MGWYELNYLDSGHGAVEGSCDHGNEPSGTVKCWETLKYMNDCQLLNKHSAP
jgi:hypothetical protein